MLDRMATSADAKPDQSNAEGQFILPLGGDLATELDGPDQKADAPGELVLRDYQQDAADQLRRAFGWAGKRRPLLQAPTGAGKTVIAAYIAKGAIAKGNRVLFVAPFLELLTQTKATFEKFGIRCSIFHGDHELDPSAPVMSATAQPISSRMAKIAEGGSRYLPQLDLGV